MDIRRCVYVLAIDFDVVRQGVQTKFGQGFDERKAIAFFDKIIQVPFHMPVPAYEVRQFLLSALGLESTPDANEYMNLAKESIGNNPRSLKRLDNTFHLLRGLSAGGEGSIETVSKQLFATLCMQTAFPLYYRELVNRTLLLLDDSTGSPESLEDFFDEELAFFEGAAAESPTESAQARSPRIGQRSRESRLRSYGMNEMDALGFARFLDLFRRAFSDNDELNQSALQSALRRAAVTSVGASPEKVESTRGIVYGPCGATPLS